MIKACFLSVFHWGRYHPRKCQKYVRACVRACVCARLEGLFGIKGRMTIQGVGSNLHTGVMKYAIGVACRVCRIWKYISRDLSCQISADVSMNLQISEKGSLQVITQTALQVILLIIKAETKKQWVCVQQGQSYFMGRRCLVSRGQPHFL